MGLFWGSKKEKAMPPPQPKPRELTDHEKLKQKLATPMELAFIPGCGTTRVAPELSYLIRRIDDSVYKNNCHIREMKEMVKELLAENRALRSRVEQLEEQQSYSSREQ